MRVPVDRRGLWMTKIGIPAVWSWRASSLRHPIGQLRSAYSADNRRAAGHL